MPSYDPSLFNIDPYYDDFSEDKKFLRLMFRPGYGVQARELTQLQTILQNQVERLGSHIFEEGSMVLDGQISENRLKYARISTNTTDPTDFIGVVMGRPNRPSFRVVHAEASSLSADSNPVLFFEYLEGVPEGGTGFLFNDIIAGTAANGAGITATITGPSVFTNPIGDGIVISVDRGVRFVEGYFVLNTQQSLAAYSLSGSSSNQVRIFDNPTTRIGFNVSKEFVTSTDDESLNDPAFGYYNYAAPGSDRFSIDLQLTQYGYTASDTTTIDNFSRVGFVEFMRIVDGDIVKVEKYPDYAVLEDTLARRTYDESGNYTVSAFDLELRGPTTANDTAVLKAELGSGKAYVFGYEFETQAKTRLNVRCARGEDHKRVVTRDFVRYVGPSTKVVFSGIPDSIGVTTDFGTHPFAYLSSGESGAAFAGLGTARVRGVEPYQESVFNLGLYDINMATGSFDSVRRVYIGQTANHAFVLTGDAGLEDESEASLLFRIPEGSGVDTFNSGDFATVAHSKHTVAGTLPYTFTIEEEVSNLSVLPSIGTVSLPNADVIVFDEDGNVCGGTASRGEDNQQLSITITSNTSNGKRLNIISTREPINDNLSMGVGSPGFVRQKVEATTNISLTGQWASITGDGRGSTSDTLYFNGYVDVLEVLALTGSKGASSGVDLLPFFDLDNGQRDAIYDWSRMTLVEGVTGVSGPFTATVRHYNRIGYGFYTVDSYPEYEEIPTYTSRTTGEIYSLRDCIDFRPDRATNGSAVSKTVWIPANTSANDNTYTYTHYLPRTDKIVLTRDRKFAVIQGIPSLEADIPEDDPNAMTLYTVRVNPYTFNSDDATIRLVENKRYTMRDIGNLEKRIEAVEYYTTLNLLEQDAKAKSIRDEFGDEMPKRGILVDQFKGHAVADNADPMFSASVDEQNNEVRPAIEVRSYDLEVTSLSTVTGNAQDGMYTLNYTQSPEIINLLASGTQYINPFAITNYMGSMVIWPSTDKWFDDKSPTKIKTNVEGENDNFRLGVQDLWADKRAIESKKSELRRRTWGASYNGWETRWFGVPNQNSKNSRPNITRTKPATAKPTGLNVASISSSVAPEAARDIVQNKTVRKDVAPRAREKQINIKAWGLKPNTDFRVYCDDMDVSGFCTGSSLRTDSKGEISNLSFFFNSPIVEGSDYDGPEQDFLVGKHTIRIADSSAPQTSTMAAEAVYTVEGVYTLMGIARLSSRLPEVRRKSVKSEKIVSNLNEILTSSAEIRGYTDPLSQTFYVDPVKYPNGVFLKSIDLYFNRKDTLSVPVTVQIRPTLSGYPHPSNVLPFATSTLYPESVAITEIITSGSTGNTNFPFSSPVYLLPGQEYAVCLSTNSPNYSVFTGQVGSTILRQSEEDPKIAITKQPLVRSLFKPQNTGKIQRAENESLAFRLNFCKFSSSGSAILQNAAITNESNILYTNEFRVNSAEIMPEGTSISYSCVMANEAGDVTYDQIAPNKNIPVKGGFHQVNSSLDAGSVAYNMAVSLSRSGNEYVSPVFDLERSSLLTVSNIINDNNITSRSSNLYNGELDPTNESSSNKALSRYISKKVNLETGMEAENLTVTMSLCNAKGASTTRPSVKVFARPVPLGETDINNVEYIELVSSGITESSSETDFREVTFTNIGHTTLPKFKTFSIKVTMFGDDKGSAVPRIRNLRIIAT